MKTTKHGIEMNNLRSTSLRRVLVRKGIEIFKSSGCIIRDWSNRWILQRQDIPNIKMTRPASRKLNCPRPYNTQQTVVFLSQTQKKLKYLRRMDFLNPRRRDYHRNLPWLSFPSIKGAKRVILASNPREVDVRDPKCNLQIFT